VPKKKEKTEKIADGPSDGPKPKGIMPAQVIQKKRDGKALTEEEITFFMDSFTKGELPDYQMAALAMATCF
jgi:hypothetical protein